MQQENVEITSSKCAFAISFAGSFFVLTMLTRIILRVTWIEARFAQ